MLRKVIFFEESVKKSY